MDSRKAAPLFLVTALIHLLALITLFQPLGKQLPIWAPWVILFAQFPVLFIASYFESKIKYNTSEHMKGWMKIDSKPVKWSFTLAFMYFAVLIVQRLDINIGPIDPTPPDSWDMMTKAKWFAVMTVGMFFPFYLATAKFLIPPMRLIMGIFKSLPQMLGVLISLLIGLAAGVAAVFGMQIAEKIIAKQTFDYAALIKTVTDMFSSNIVMVLAVTFGAILLPILLGSIAGRNREA